MIRGFQPSEANLARPRPFINRSDTGIKVDEEDEGIIKQLNAAYMAAHPKAVYDPEIIYNWDPYLKLVPANHENKGIPYTSEQLSAKKKDSVAIGNPWNPNYFINPYQDLDYMMIEGALKTTFVGAEMNALTRFIVGKGFRPELELINPDKDEQKNAETLAKYTKVLDFLKSIDRYVDRRVPGRINMPLIELMTALIDTTNSFNRSALMFIYDKEHPFKDEDGKEWPLVPTTLRHAHPRDLGIIETDPLTQGLVSVQWNYNFQQISVDDMIYLWNPLVSAKYHNATFYGGSMVLPMLDAARTVRSLIGDDFPAMARNTWAGVPIITVDPEGASVEDREAEYGNLVGRFVVGGINIFLKHPDQVRVDNINLDPKVLEFQKLSDFLLRYSVASVGLPQTLFFDETTSTRSTMLGKIQLAMSVQIEPIRESINRQVNPQWYQKWLEMKYAGTDILKIVKAKLVWEDLHVEKWFDKVEAVNMVDARLPLKNKAYGDLSGIPDYVNKVVDNSGVVPGGDSSQLEPSDPPDSRLEQRGKEAK